ncbi:MULTISPECIES: glyceraldehyde-3-phosphate dehydrogenase [Alishewanella]|uniref:Glyceraldehyde-3-phosphate dehydrogenase n=2 Tax=Alishewanella TaxID=111142 RepID=H3ZAH9_9ALTE|nr:MULTISPECIES: glyceraldehyde-3-phosphate dehydrogenase [Alishewanella]EHR41943.1 glyceraldehyde-3-phosphate dehydrogenase [Alishewanella jeotgali KCTC 22429]EJI84013.1 glyceraldehyde-3-phosphate dehydrogenase [Alishewanella aestuarii B11]MCT8125813.1 glyceraldehyde-3-phosphate dehydrogenase [Alishewanella sp. BS5-314]OCW93197.1 type I glyceraldehyde-3-phosphate dehydrogenase [Alishewanella sp. HH-ZS]
MTLSHAEQYQKSWQERQEYAENMLPIIGRLYRNKGIEVVIYGRPLVNATIIDIIKAHKTVQRFEGQKLRLRESFPVLEAISKMNLAPGRVDIGKLAYAFLYKNVAEGLTLEQYLARELSQILDHEDKVKPVDVVLYGFGRIGRLLARLMLERSGPSVKLRLKAIVVRGGKQGDLEKRASLLRRDSIHGPFNGSITVDEENQGIKANGTFIKVIYANSPEEVDYTAYGIDNALVVDNTGIFKDDVGLSVHLKSKGAAKVLLTAPAKGDVPNIVYGVNQHMITPDRTIVSAASCTTNAITPVLKALNDEYGIRNGHVETVHSYTNDQNLIDNFHKAERRGRAAPLNMVLTSTGAASAVAKALPELKGKLTGNAIRVPTPNVSMAILSLNLNRETSKDELNNFLQNTSLFSELQDQIDFTSSTEIVSSDLVGSRYAGVVDSQATIVDGDRCVLYVWYDNEFGYSVQVTRVMNEMAGITYPTLPVAK